MWSPASLWQHHAVTLWNLLYMTLNFLFHLSLDNMPQECDGIAKNIFPYIVLIHAWSVHTSLSLKLFVLWSWKSSASPSLMLIAVYLWAAIFSSPNFVSLVKLAMCSSYTPLLPLSSSSPAVFHCTLMLKSIYLECEDQNSAYSYRM